MRSLCSLSLFLSIAIRCPSLIQQLGMIFYLNLRISRLLTILVFVLVSMSAYSQPQVKEKEQKNDSLCPDSLKIYPDTISLTQNHLYQLSAQTKAKSSKSISKDFNFPKIDPYKKKFTDLQILNDIRRHLSR